MKRFFKILVKFSLFILFSILLLGGYVFLRYRSWEKDFERVIREEYLITQENVATVSLEERLVEFVVSSSDTEFLELEVNEFGAILFDVLDGYTKGKPVLTGMYIYPADSKWVIYVKFEYKSIEVWFSIDLNKDSIQTAQLYTKEIYCGPFPIHNYTDWEEAINKGIADAIVTLNENGFVGRYIENIELLEDGIVFKGSRY